MKKIGTSIITFIMVFELFSLEASCAVDKSLSPLSESDNEFKIVIGIIILSLITALITVKRAISAKKNN